MSSELDPGALAAFVDESVFAQMSEELGADASAKKNLLDAWMLEEYPDKAILQLEASQKEIQKLIRVKIREIYGHTRVSCNLAETIGAKTVKDLLAKFVPEARSGTPKLDENEMKRIAEAFTKGRYIGEAHLDLAEYLRDCWKDYTRSKYKAPCVAVVQSSGFGKSRTMCELAIEAQKSALNMKVLYMCARVHESTGFPKATSELCGWLFHEGSEVEDIASRLKAIYVYANKHWANVQTEWLELFTEKAADSSVKAKLSNETDELDRDTSTVKNPDGKMVVLVIDEARSLLAEKPGKKNDFRMLRNALRLANKDIGHRGCIFGVLIDTNSRISDLAPPLLLDPSSRVFDGELASFAPVVLAETMDTHWDQYCEGNPAGEDEEMKEDIHDVDEEMKEEILDVDVGAGDEEMEEETQVGVGAKDEEKTEQQERAKIGMYKRIVTGDADHAWHALCRMGRPMWYSTCPKPADREDRINLAANKLLLRLPPSEAAYTKDTMFGVASMLCRLGVRPRSTSALASRATADFMAILAYVNFKREGYVSSYASDPVLALGAMKVWYELPDGLAKYILPELKNLVLDEALDIGGTGEVGEMVARILLLLATDKCVMGDKHFSQCYDTIGQFVPVQQFLGVLQGNGDMPIYRKGMYNAEDKRPEFNEWCSQWEGWYVGFTHFVQLHLEPNEDTLWFLLGRRAAGIFPRNQYGADLLIPMFKKRSTSKPVGEETAGDDDEKEEKHEVLMMLIQVKNRSSVDKGFFKAATKKLCPWFVFGNLSGKKSTDEIDGGPNPLSSTDVRDTIRIYMNVRVRKRDAEEEGEVGSNSSVSSISKDVEEEEGGPIFTICLRLLNTVTYPFLREDVATILSNMVESQYDPIGLVKGDLDYRDEDEERNKDVSAYAKVSVTAKSARLLKSARKALSYAQSHKVNGAGQYNGGGSKGGNKISQGGNSGVSNKRARTNQDEGHPTKPSK